MFSIENIKNPSLTGKDGGEVAFVNGVGHTESKWIANWYKGNGYKVEEIQEETPKQEETPADKKSKK